MMMSFLKKYVLLAAGVLFACSASAQWQTQTNVLKPGWNAMFLHVEATYENINVLAATNNLGAPMPIEEIWLWKPDVSTVQYLTSPQEPVDGGSQWLVWKLGKPAETTLSSLVGNSAYLVKVSGATNINWTVKGKPLPPRHIWTTSGVNFIGYSSPAGGAPDLDAFLSAASGKLLDLDHYEYDGGLLADNPTKVSNLRGTTIDRGKAFWVKSKSSSFNRHFGAFETVLQDNAGVGFGTQLGRYGIRLRNLVDQEITVIANVLASESAPPSQTIYSGAPPLLLRGALNTTNLTYGSTTFTNGTSWVLKPKGEIGSEVEIVIGLDRSSMSGMAGDQFAAILRLTDSLNFSQMDLPVSATVAANTGLWIGSAEINEVRHNLVSFQKSGGDPVQDSEGRYVRVSTNSAYGSVIQPFPLRLIVHHGEYGPSTNRTTETVLMQRVFHGLDASTNTILATAQSLLDKRFISTAGRISVVHLPWSGANGTWTFSGAFHEGTNATVSVTNSFSSHASNPFLHTYHPDHDNLNATFKATQPEGRESYTVVRDINLSFTAPDNDFDSRTAGNKTMTGVYEESLTLKGLTGNQRQYFTRGNFALNRISDIGELKRP